jgi:signal transduction histidine kinase/ActR/RegA family two-component response regulator
MAHVPRRGRPFMIDGAGIADQHEPAQMLYGGGRRETQVSDIKRPHALRRLLRLIIIVALMLLPASVALMNFQHRVQADHDQDARASALSQAELLKNSLGAVVDGVHQMMTAVAHIDVVARLDSACSIVLRDLQEKLASYAFIAVADSDGTLVCDSGPKLPPDTVRTLAASAGRGGFTLGAYQRGDGVFPAFFNFALPFASVDGKRRGVVLAGLSVAWLGEFLHAIKRPEGSILSVADRNGIVIAREPSPDRYVGQPVLPDVQALLHRPYAGTAVVRSFEGPRRVIGFVPDSVAPVGLYVSAGFLFDTLNADIDAGAGQGYLTLIGVAVLSMLLAFAVGQRVVQAPTGVLLRVANAVEQGDLSARAKMPRGSAGEFFAIGSAFNAMALKLEQQRAELQSLNGALEARVAERTQALLASNNQLQVEIAEREATESGLRQTQKLQAVGQLAGGIAHDFNNLLTAVLGSLELLRRRIAPEEMDVVRLLDTAHAAVERGTRLTAKLLGFSRKQPLLTVPIDVATTIEAMAALLASTLGAEIWMETRLSPSLWTTAIDPNQFETAILNLALNARDAMPGGGRLLIAASNRVVTPGPGPLDLPAGDYVAVVVTDSGRGMSDDVLARAFEPFFTTQGPGLAAGLGLSQVHGLVRQSGGEVRIDSRLGQGTRVTMLLPRTLQAPVRYASTGPASLPLQPRPDRVILLVDDDDGVRDVTASLLMDGGFTVVQAASGPAALVCLADSAKRIRFVVADFAMPGMNGHELRNQVRQVRPDLPVLLITGYADFSAVTKGEWAAADILRKPFRGKELIGRIEAMWEWEVNPSPEPQSPLPHWT